MEEENSGKLEFLEGLARDSHPTLARASKALMKPYWIRNSKSVPGTCVLTSLFR